MKAIIVSLMLMFASTSALAVDPPILQTFINTASCAAITAGGEGYDEGSAQSLADAHDAFEKAAQVLAHQIIAEVPGWNEVTYPQMYNTVANSWHEQPIEIIQQMGELCMRVHHAYKNRSDESLIILIPGPDGDLVEPESAMPALPEGRPI